MIADIRDRGTTDGPLGPATPACSYAALMILLFCFVVPSAAAAFAAGVEPSLSHPLGGHSLATREEWTAPQGGSQTSRSPAEEEDPEASPGGRRRYLGRTVARTMHWAGAPWLMRETRENEENGELLRTWLDVQPGDRVADLGCGNGYHTLPLAQAVGAEGLVYAVDLQPEMLELLKERAEEASSSESSPAGATVLPIETRVATVDDPNLPDASCDFVLMVDVYHELSHPVRVLNGIRRALRKGGVVVLVEFRAEDRSVPIKPLHKMTKAQVIAEMAAGGMRLAAETDELPWQHAMAFEAAPKEARGAKLEALAMAEGFLDAIRLGDARVVLPFLDDDVRTEDGTLLDDAKAFSVRIHEAMKAAEGSIVPDEARVTIEPSADGNSATGVIDVEPSTVFESRTRLELRRDESGVFRVSGWLARS